MSLQILSANVWRDTLLLLVFLCGLFPWVSFSLQIGKGTFELFGNSVHSASFSSERPLWLSKEKGHSPVIFRSFSLVQNMMHNSFIHQRCIFTLWWSCLLCQRKAPNSKCCHETLGIAKSTTQTVVAIPAIEEERKSWRETEGTVLYTSFVWFNFLRSSLLIQWTVVFWSTIITSCVCSVSSSWDWFISTFHIIIIISYITRRSHSVLQPVQKLLGIHMHRFV